MHAYAALMGELPYIAINTVRQLRYTMSILTRYTSKGGSSHGVVAGSLASCTQ